MLSFLQALIEQSFSVYSAPKLEDRDGEQNKSPRASYLLNKRIWEDEVGWEGESLSKDLFPLPLFLRSPPSAWWWEERGSTTTFLMTYLPPCWTFVLPSHCFSNAKCGSQGEHQLLFPHTLLLTAPVHPCSLVLFSSFAFGYLPSRNSLPCKVPMLGAGEHHLSSPPPTDHHWTGAWRPQATKSWAVELVRSVVHLGCLKWPLLAILQAGLGQQEGGQHCLLSSLPQGVGYSG